MNNSIANFKFRKNPHPGGIRTHGRDDSLNPRDSDFTKVRRYVEIFFPK
jgi:hypothetical protein